MTSLILVQSGTWNVTFFQPEPNLGFFQFKIMQRLGGQSDLRISSVWFCVWSQFNGLLMFYLQITGNKLLTSWALSSSSGARSSRLSNFPSTSIWLSNFPPSVRSLGLSNFLWFSGFRRLVSTRSSGFLLCPTRLSGFRTRLSGFRSPTISSTTRLSSSESLLNKLLDLGEDEFWNFYKDSASCDTSSWALQLE